MVGDKEIEDKILSIFAEVAGSIGYSPLHGKIIGILLVKGKPMALQDLSRETGYSLGMISISLDLLELLGVIRKARKTNDRKLYIELTGDLLEALKNAIVIRVQKSISSSLQEFEKSKKHAKKETLKTISILEKELKRLDRYVGLLSRIKLP